MIYLVAPDSRLYQQEYRLAGEELSGCTSLTSLPAGVSVGGDLKLYGCTRLTSLPAGLTVQGNLKLYGCTSLTSLPAGLTAGGNLDLSGCTRLTSLPAGVSVGGDLKLYGCTRLTSLPAGLTVGGNLNLSSCHRITSLPAGLTVGGNLNLSSCHRITSLPAGVSVGGDLKLSGCTSLAELPAWVFNVDNLLRVPNQLEAYATKFRILKHFDNNSDINAINDTELETYYNTNKVELDKLMQKRHCLRIAWACIENKRLTSQQQQFRETAKEEAKNEIRDQLLKITHHFKIILRSKPDLFKQLPGINNAEFVQEKWSQLLPYTFNHGYNNTCDVQLARSVNHYSKTIF